MGIGRTVSEPQDMSIHPVASGAFARARAHALCVATLVVLATVVATPAQAVFNPLECVAGIDNVGMVVAAGGDYNGDGVRDFAYSAPCSRVGKFDHSGRIWIRDGKNGHLLRRAVGGPQVDLFLGAELAFIGDINGDG